MDDRTNKPEAWKPGTRTQVVVTLVMIAAIVLVGLAAFSAEGSPDITVHGTVAGIDLLSGTKRYGQVTWSTGQVILMSAGSIEHLRIGKHYDLRLEEIMRKKYYRIAEWL